LSPTFLKVRRVVVAASAVGMVALHALHLTVAPPARYPDIYPLLFAVFSFGHFMLAYVYCVAWQWSSREVESMALRTNTKAE
jgi:hypothetical protein